jgi:acyl-coenzyme A thioesterase PaaI-like protein
MEVAEMMPFAAVLGIELLGAGPDEVRARVAWQPSRCTAGGVLPGGVRAGRLVARTTQTQAVIPSSRQ